MQPTTAADRHDVGRMQITASLTGDTEEVVGNEQTTNVGEVRGALHEAKNLVGESDHSVNGESKGGQPRALQ
jgi:hypothetical protein